MSIVQPDLSFLSESIDGIFLTKRLCKAILFHRIEGNPEEPMATKLHKKFSHKTMQRAKNENVAIFREEICTMGILSL